ncbi:MAG: hypothetical protein K1X67_10495 [Fimbriimonadaceae bacterium]|nr:hypothetical protein [Fimbriimonadaceae bacterium]
MPFIHTPDSVAWKAAFEHYNWDRLAEAWELVEEFGVGEASVNLGFYRLIEGEWRTRDRSDITRVNPWLKVELVLDEIGPDQTDLVELLVRACDQVAERLNWQHGPETLISLLAAEVDRPWATNPYGYCVDKHPYEKICLPYHLLDQPGQLFEATAHEYAHVVSLNLSQGRVARWLSEAVSVLIERPENRYASRKFRSGGWHWRRPEELEGMFNVNSEDIAGVQMAYAQSGLIGRFLASQPGGEAKLSELLAELAKNNLWSDFRRQFAGRSRADAALRSVYGLSEDQVFDLAFDSLRHDSAYN